MLKVNGKSFVATTFLVAFFFTNVIMANANTETDVLTIDLIKQSADKVDFLQNELDKYDDQSFNILKSKAALVNYVATSSAYATPVDSKEIKVKVAEAKKSLIELKTEINKNKGEIKEVSLLIFNKGKNDIIKAEKMISDGNYYVALIILEAAARFADSLQGELYESRVNGIYPSMYSVDRAMANMAVDDLSEKIAIVEILMKGETTKSTVLKYKKLLTKTKKDFARADKEFKQQRYMLAYVRSSFSAETINSESPVIFLEEFNKPNKSSNQSISVERAETQIDKAYKLLLELKKTYPSNFPKTFTDKYTSHLDKGSAIFVFARNKYRLSDFDSAYNYAVEAYNELNKASQMFKG